MPFQQWQLALKLANLQGFSGSEQWLWQLKQALWSASAFFHRNKPQRTAMALHVFQLWKFVHVYIYILYMKLLLKHADWNAYKVKIMAIVPCRFVHHFFFIQINSFYYLKINSSQIQSGLRNPSSHILYSMCMIQHEMCSHSLVGFPRTNYQCIYSNITIIITVLWYLTHSTIIARKYCIFYFTVFRVKWQILQASSQQSVHKT